MRNNLGKSELGGSILGQVLCVGRGEKVGRELGRLRHVALDLHLALHECNLGVQLAHAHCLEIVVRHREGRICIRRSAARGLALSALEVDRVD